MLRVLLIFLFASLALGQAADPGPARDDELTALRQQIAEHRAAAERLARDEKGAIRRVAEIEKEMSLLKELLDGLQRRQVELEEERVALESRLSTASETIDERRDQLAYHLRMLYRQKRRSELGALLGSSSVDNAAARLRAWMHVARTERKMIEEVRESQLVLGENRAALESSLSELELTQSEAITRQSELEALGVERNGELGRIRRMKTHHLEAMKEKEESAQQLESFLARLEDKRRSEGLPDGGDFASRRGFLQWPVEGEVTQGFGRSVHPRFKTVTEHKGISIAAAEGTPVQVVADGKVQYVNWLPGYGKCVIVNHGGGYYTFYAHASAIFPAEGQSVKAGDVIAEVGDTGSLDGAQLYFELRAGKQAVDPMGWLVGGAAKR